MAGRRRSNSFHLTNSLLSIMPTSLQQPFRSSGRLPCLLLWASLVVSLLLGVWAVAAFHSIQIKVQTAVEQQGFGALGLEPAADRGQRLSQNSVAAAGALAAISSVTKQGQTQQVQVQVIVTNAQQHSQKMQASSSVDTPEAAAHAAANRAKQLSADTSAPTPGPPPKIALLFLVKDRIGNDAVWRAFFQKAARLQLQPHLAAAAANTAQRNSKVKVSDAIGSTALHPGLGTFLPWAYPGYRVQHGFTSGAEPPPWRDHFAADQAAAAKPAPAPAQAHSVAAGTASGGSKSVFPAHEWESERLRQAVQELQEAQRLQHGHAGDAGSPAQTDAPASEQEQLPWSPFKQLSTMQQALQAAAQRESQQIDRSTSKAAGSQHMTPSHQWHTDHWRCLALLGLASTAVGQGASAQTAGSPQPQHALFSVYVHTTAGALLPQGSVLSGCELPVRLNTTRGYAQHVLTEAAALLLRAALSDPLNAKFVLVSDTSLPIYPPQVIWSQLMYEPLSRLDACITPGRSTHAFRWRNLMKTEHFGKQHWRKSSQWFALSRAHALLATADDHVRESLRRYCYTNMTRNNPTCVSDEHWLPSLMATYGLDQETDCEGNSHYADWSAGGWHPKTFAVQDLNLQLVTAMRAGVPLEVVRQAAAQQTTRMHGMSQLSGSAEQTATRLPATAAPRIPVAAASGQQQSHKASSAMQSQPVPHYKVDWSARLPEATLAAAAAQCNSAQAVSTASSRVFQPTQLAADKEQFAGQAAWQWQRQQLQALSVKWLGRLALLAGGVGVSANKTGGSTHAQTAEHWLIAAGYLPLGQRCPLFARKFPANAEQEVLSMSLS